MAAHRRHGRALARSRPRPYFGNLVDGKFDVALYPLTVPADDVTAQHQSYLTNEKSPISYARHNDKKLDELWDEQSARSIPPSARRIVHEFERAC